MSAEPGMAPRIPPGTRAEIGRINGLVCAAIGLGAGGRPPNVFTTLARHRRLFRRWLGFASGLMPGGRLPRRDTELLILRTARNCGCEYEWHHHERIGKLAGLSAEEIEALREQQPDPSTDRDRLLVRAADELHAERRLSDETWTALSRHLDEAQLIELPLLVGHYEMLAMVIESIRIQPDPPANGTPGLASRFLSRRR